MKTQAILVATLAASAMMTLSGCLVVAAAAVAGGAVHATGDDTAEVLIERPYDAVFAALEAEVEAIGHAEIRDQRSGYLEGHVDGARIEVFLEQRSPSSVNLRCKARKNAGISPAPDVAEKVAFGTVKRLGY